MTGYSWVKIPLRYRKDPKFQTSLDDGQKWRFLEMYMLVHEYHTDKGEFCRNGEPLTVEEIAYEVHRDPDQVRTDMQTFLGLGLFAENGHGPYITSYKADQEPVPAKQRMSEMRDRTLQGSYVPVTTCHIESESDIESESERESESEGQSVISESVQSTDKKQICTHFGIPPKYSKSIIQDPAITTDDLLSDLTKQYSRKGKGKVENPGYITGMNLTKTPPEKPGPEWYDPITWKKHLPGSLLEKLGLGDLASCSTVQAKVDTFLSR